MRPFVLLFVLFFSTINGVCQKSDIILSFNKPASFFTESLPLGNGRLGAMVFGGTTKDRIALNEISLWSGGPQDADREDAWQSLKPIQDFLIQGKNKEAQELLQKNFVAKGRGSGYGGGANDKYGCYQTMGDLIISWKDSNSALSYYSRILDIENAVATTSFKRNGNTIKQEVLADYVNDIIWIKLSSTGKLNFSLDLYRKENVSISIKDNLLIMNGQLPSEKEHGMQFQTIAQPILKNGEITAQNNQLHIKDASECWIKVSMTTNYDYSSGKLTEENLTEKTHSYLGKAGNDFTLAKTKSTAAYKKYFEKSRLTFPENTEVKNLTTAERLKRYSEGKQDEELVALYYNYGRYLLISSSRKGLLPANLQGLWATEYQTPWNGDYHLNINIQMNYWPAELTGLGDLAEPLHRFTKSLVPNGQKTAKAYYNAEGWVAHVISNPWFYTSPGEGADWGSTLTGGAWLCEHIWEHYRFTQDKEFLKQYYPVLKGAAQFIQSILIREPQNGWLVTAPSNSPEHAYFTPDGFKGNTAMGPTMDMQIARELFNACVSASEILKTDVTWRNEIKEIIMQLAPNQIGKKGDLNEWLHDWEDAEPKHRHVSHLYGLHPYDEINVNTTPELAEAAKKTLAQRGDEGTGWSMAWKINFWARLHDGDHALLLLKKLLKPVTEQSIKMNGGGGTYANLFCAHPPFQIDGNFGATAGIAEMLLQSNDHSIELLPALPSVWKKGFVSGLNARGGFTVNITWEENRLKEATLISTAGKDCTIKLDDKYRIYTKKGKPVQYNTKNGWISFKTTKGVSYIIK
jgi:alpha-L-fucosidase 2